MKIEVITISTVKNLIDKELRPLGSKLNEMMMDVAILKEEMKTINKEIKILQKR